MLLDRFWNKIKVNKTTGCWEWTASQNGRGYGQFYISGGRAKPIKKGAHVFAFEYYVGPIDKGKQIDHKCSVTYCVNPEHLQQVDFCENMNLAAQRKENYCSAKTHCKWGHEFTKENTHLYNRRGKIERVCKQCWTKRGVRV